MINLFAKISDLLPPNERIRLSILLFLAAIGGLIQLAGVGSVMPFVAVLTDPTIIEEQAVLQWLNDVTGDRGTNQFLLILGVLMLLAFMLANALLASTLWYTFRFARLVQYRLSRQLLEIYLEKPYSYYLSNNSAEAGRNILSETQVFSQHVLVPTLSATAFGMTLIFMTAFLFWLSPFVALITVGMISFSYVVIFAFFRSKLGELGILRLRSNTAQFKAVNEAFGAMKEIKVSGYEKTFLSAYDQNAIRFAHAQAGEQMLAHVPRYLIEVVGIGAMVVIVLSLVAIGRDFESIIPLVTVYAVAGYRLLPAFQFVYQGVSQLRANSGVVHTLHAELLPQRVDAHPIHVERAGNRIMGFKQGIQFRDVSFTYPGRRTAAIDEVSIEIPCGSFIAVTGQTGAGKSTFTDLILGLTSPDSGQVLIDGIELGVGNTHEWQKQVGYVPQRIYLMDASVAQNIAFGIPENKIDLAKVVEAAKLANIHDFIVNELPEGYDSSVGEQGLNLSGGQRQRIGIARAAYRDPSLFVLDEATSGLDWSTEQAVLNKLEGIVGDKTIIAIAHSSELVRRAHTVLRFERGRLHVETRSNESVSR